MSTNVDLKVGLNLEIGSVPVSLVAEVATSDTQTAYTFDGCMQTAKINIGDFISYVGQQFSVDVQLPPELNLEAIIDYVAGQVIYTSYAESQNKKPTTELGVAAKFDLVYSNGGPEQKFTFTFYADTILTSPAPATGNPYVIGGAIDTDLKFADLPLVGSIPGFNQYTLKHLGFSYTNVDPQQNQATSFHIPKVDVSANPLYTQQSGDGKDKNNYSINSKGPQTSFNLSQKGFSFTAGLMKEGSSQAESNFSLPMALPPAANTNTPANYYKGTGVVNASPPASSVHWINVNKTFGPVNLQKIGLNYSQGEATFGFSAGLAVGGFSLDVQGLAITFPLPLPGMPAGKTVSFDIQGLGLEFQSGGLTIGGAFLKTQVGSINNYFGEVMVQVGSFGFNAIGGYAPAQDGNPAAFFIYARLEAPLGGPPFLYVTGLAFGFGVNYGLVLPTIQTLPTYLLLPHNAPQQGSAGDALKEVISSLVNGSVIKYEPGEYWVGAGIEFTSFDMISAFAMLTFSFGVEMQVALIGSCSISLPKGVPDALAEIEIDLVASFTPSTGLLSVAGVIAPSSYVFGPFVKLSGGFAFLIFFSGDNKGQFVVTLGGYHPSFTSRPKWYPDVPRIRLQFALGPFQASGSAYLALTPAMFMAGFAFSASFTAGPVKVWFNMGADFLISWAPFLYNADAYVNLGCSIDLGLFTLTVHIGADLQIWGPPFGGKADVDLDVVSFTISFGSPAAEPPPITWQNLEQNFLPKPTSSKTPGMMKMAATANNTPFTADDATANVSASVSVGLVNKDITSQDGENWNWIVDPDNFVIITATTIPANYAKWGIADGGKTTDISHDPAQYDLPKVDVSEHPYLELIPKTKAFSDTDVWNPTVHVAPMNIKDVQSIHTITVRKHADTDAKGKFTDYIKAVTIEPVLGESNTALWGLPGKKTDANAPLTLPKTLEGFQITPLPRNPDTVNNVPLINLLFTQGEKTNFSYTSSQPDGSYKVSIQPDPPTDKMNINISGNVTKELLNNNFILSSLIDQWVVGQRSTVLNDLLANGFDVYTPDAVTLNDMGKTEALVDWPMVAILGKN